MPEGKAQKRLTDRPPDYWFTTIKRRSEPAKEIWFSQTSTPLVSIPSHLCVYSRQFKDPLATEIKSVPFLQDDVEKKNEYNIMKKLLKETMLENIMYIFASSLKTL